MNLTDGRRAMRHLLDERDPADARAVYYALQYDDARTQITTYRPNAPRAIGYVCQSRTGYDLFRPLVTMRLPIHHLDESAAILYHSLIPGSPLILNIPEAYMPLVMGVFDIFAEEEYKVLVLDQGRYRPILNVLVTHETASNGLPSYVIRHQNQRAAVASINWQINHFADMALTFDNKTRRTAWAESIVAALSGHIVDQGRIPLLTVQEGDDFSAEAAQSVGFVDLGVREYMVEAVLRPQT
ncbi:MAG: hypothetical protein M9930_20140 [Anaerolineae bacterium]|nr:hypothetical protein [Anaerolineae bacterium]